MHVDKGGDLIIYMNSKQHSPHPGSSSHYRVSSVIHEEVWQDRSVCSPVLGAKSVVT